MADALRNKTTLIILAAAIPLGAIFGIAAGTDPKQLLIALVTIAVVGVCLLSRWWGLLLLVGLAPFYGFIRFVLEISPAQALFKEAMLILITVSWITEDVVIRRRPFAPNRIMLPLGVYLFALVIQFLRSPDPFQAVFGLRVYATYIPVFYVLLTEQPSDRQVKTALMVIGIATAMTIVYGLVQSAMGLEWLEAAGLAKAGPNIRAMGQLRVFSTYAGPEYFAVNLALHSFLLFALIITTDKAWLKPAALAVIGLIAMQLALTLYRSIWVMTLLGFAAMLFVVRKYRYILVIVLAVVAVIQFTPSYIKERAMVTFTNEDISYQTRKELYLKTNVTDIASNLVGYGVGSAMGMESYQNLTGHRSIVRLLSGGSTESWLVSLTIDLGLLGLAVYCWLQFTIIGMAYGVWRHASSLVWKGLGLAFTGFAVSQLIVSSFFQVPACFPAGDLYFWFFTGLLAVKSSQLSQEEGVAPQGTSE